MNWEVQIMESRTSFFNRTVFRKALTSNVPLWVCYWIALLFLLPFGCLHSGNAENICSAVVLAGAFISLLFGLGAAIVCFRYLNQTRSAYMLHAFPLTRLTLFASNGLAGLCMGIVPFLLTFWLSGIYFRLAFGLLIRLCLVYCGSFLFFYSLAVFCMIVTGHSVAAAVLYGFLNLAAVVMEDLIRFLAEPLLCGIRHEDYLTSAFSPAVYLSELSFNGDLPLLEGRLDTLLHGYLLILALLGLLFLCAAYYLYRLRHIENAGEIVAHKASRPIFKYLVTFVSTLALGEFFSLIVFGGVDSYSNTLYVTLMLLLGAFLGYFGAEMLLKKSLRVFTARNILIFALCSALICGAIACLYGDVFGIVHKVPDAEKVVSAELRVSSKLDVPIVLTEQEDLENLTKLQRELIEEHPEDGWHRCEIRYLMEDGSSLERSYWVDYDSRVRPDLEILCSKPGVAEAWLDKAFDSYSVIRLDYWRQIEPIQTDPDPDNSAASEEVWNSLEFTGKTRELLLEALKADVRDGNLSIWRDSYDIVAEIDFYYSAEDGWKSGSLAGWIGLPKSCSNTLSYLEVLKNA